MRLFLYEFASIIYKLTDYNILSYELKAKINAYILNIERMLELEKIQAGNNLFTEISEYINEQVINNQDTVFAQIKEYLDGNFTNSEISLKLLECKYNLSASYISIVFKKKYDMTISNYIEEKRIRLACELLLKNKIESIGNIAISSGYNSATVFGRVFRKKIGLTPLEYWCL
jgi:YesN/AraC family two-component response regulator